MKPLSGKRFAALESLFVGVFLFVYALILLVSDPEWLMWAGPITLGALPVTAPMLPPAFDAMETFQVASYSVLPGLLAWILLTRSRVTERSYRHSAIPGQDAAETRGVTHAAQEHRKAA
jgi:hypothetical protein